MIQGIAARRNHAAHAAERCLNSPTPPTPPQQTRVRVLFLGGTADEATALRETLGGSEAMSFAVVHAPRISDALAEPDAKETDVAILAVGRGDVPSLSSLGQARSALPGVPIVVISDVDEEVVALRALQGGARGYLVKSKLGTRLLVTTVVAALESQRVILQLNSAREHARHLATHDQLTGLANRSEFRERLAEAISQARRSRTKLAVMLLDIDDFKTVNDTLGSAVGDGLLRGIARRITASLRETDFAARLGGDEFAVLLTNLTNESDAGVVAQKMLATLGEPIHFSRQLAPIRASFGIATFPRDATEPDDLVAKSDTARVRAKENGGHRFEFYTKDMNAAILRRVALEERLRTALQENQLRLHYQPQFDLARGRIMGAEALLRWQHPDLGLVPPLQFLPIAEENGLIIPIGDWVLQTACQQNAAWIRQGYGPLRIAVNVSAQQFVEPGFADVVKSALKDSGLPAMALEIEITESSLLRDVEVIVNTLSSLRDLGVRLAIDDFGTGYSALSYLKRLPVDVLKIDQSFVRALTTDPADATITQTIVRLAAGLNLSTVAEGVETAEQLLLLASYGITRVQGYLIGKPVPPDEFDDWLKDPPFRWVPDGQANTS